MQQRNQILVVEDENILAIDISHQLKSAGYNVIGMISNGEDCIHQIQSLKPDVILMDVKLSGKLNGIETAEKIQELMVVPIVFLTAYSDDNTLQSIKRTGHYGFVKKPYKATDLITEIEFTLDRFNKLLNLLSEQEKSRKSLKENEVFFKQLVNNVSDIIYRIDLKGYFTYVNMSTIDQTGFSEDQLMQMKFSLLVRDDYKSTVYFFFKNIFENEVEDSYLEFPLITANNQEKWLGQNIHLLKIDNLIVGFQIVARDITQEKEFQDYLITAKQSAEKIAEMKSLFLANMSHEIRTPLNGIIGIVNLLHNTDLSDKQKSYLQAISTSSNQLMGIINDVLDLSKIDAGKVELELTNFDMLELIHSATAVFEMKCADKNITIDTFVDDQMPKMLVGDPVRLNQIIYNLVGNAIKFTEKGGIFIQVKVIETSDEEIQVLIIISDTGIGMEQSIINKVFDAFTQAENHTTRKYGGTGLGLTIVKNLVEIQGGTIEVKSEPNQGTCFKILLPFTKSQIIDNESQLKVKYPTFSVFGKSILLVEDNKVNQLVTKDLIEDQGATVTIAEHGEMALGILDNESFDLVLMDMQMPVLDGYQTMLKIRRSINAIKRQMPIIALTANAIDTEIKKCYEYGADDYMSKPFKPEILFEKISGLLPISKALSGLELTNEEAVDIQSVSYYLNGKKELFKSTFFELIEAFSNDFVLLKQVLINKDAKQIKEIVHRLKPNFLLLGLNGLNELCISCENKTELEEILEKAAEILVALPFIIDQLKAIIKETN
jgi:PAS domain S-box-containing protein